MRRNQTIVAAAATLFFLMGCEAQQNDAEDAINERASSDPNSRAPSELIVKLKDGHKNTCVPNIGKQLRDVGISASDEDVDSYCSCLGTLYFNDLSNAELSEMVDRPGALPARIEAQREILQQQCASLHLSEAQ